MPRKNMKKANRELIYRHVMTADCMSAYGDLYGPDGEDAGGNTDGPLPRRQGLFDFAQITFAKGYVLVQEASLVEALQELERLRKIAYPNQEF